MSEQTQDRSSSIGEFPTLPPGRGSRPLLPLRLAVRFLCGGDLTDRVRALLTVVAIALSVTVVLLATVAVSALASREDRSDALTPAYINPSWAPTIETTGTPSINSLLTVPGRFLAEVDEQPYRGVPVTVVTVVAGTSGQVASPPGAQVAPGPGQAVVSAALADLLSGADGDDLRARIPQTVIGTLTPAGVLDDGDLRAYVGAVLPADPSIALSSDVADGWGVSDLPPELRPGATVRVLLLAGAVVVVTPLLVLIGLLGRLSGPARARRLATLRLLGVSSNVARTLAAGESGLLGLTGTVLAIAAFPLMGRVLQRLPLDGIPLSAHSVGLSLTTLLGGAVLVSLVTAMTGSIGAGRTTAPEWMTTRRIGGWSPRWWPGLVLTVGGLVLVGYGLYEGGLYGSRDGLVALCTGLAGTLISVALLAGPAVAAAGRILRERGPMASLAGARIMAEPHSRAATVAGVGVVLAGAIALQSVLTLVAADRTGGEDVVVPSYRVYLTADRSGLTVEDVTAVVDTVSVQPGVDAMTGGISLVGEWGTGITTAADGSIDMTHYLDVLITPCRAVPERPDCRDGDVFWLDTDTSGNAAPIDPPPGTALRFRSGGASDLGTGPDVVEWVMPTPTHRVAVDRGLRGGAAPRVVVTPGALGTLAGAPAGSIDLRVFGDASSSVADHLRSQLTRQGWQVVLSTTAEATGARGTLLVAGRAGLVGTAALTLLAALGGLVVLTFSQLHRSRRAIAVALAAGWSRTFLRRSFVVEAAASAAAVVPIAILVAYALAALMTNFGHPVTGLPHPGLAAALAAGSWGATVLAAWLAATLAVRTVDVTDLRTT